MKAVLLVLSGHPARAREHLRMLFPEAEIEGLARAEVESSTSRKALQALRALRPDVLVIATERLAWQRGQNALMLFGALAGVRRFILLDARDGIRDEAWTQILAKAPFRIAAEIARSALAIAKSHSHLSRLESAVRIRAPTVSHKSAARNTDLIRIAYLRSTPSAGTQAGGAATHINGFVRGATGLGAEVKVISNDRIAGLDETRLVLIDPEPVGTTRAAFDLRNNLIFSAGALREIERSPVDLVYQRYGRFAWAGVEAALRTSLPLCLEY